MPRIEFKEENVRKNDYDYPKFKLEKGETARIVLLEDPMGEFVHTIHKPKLESGVPVKEIKSRKDGSQYEDYKYEFVAQALCTGDFGVLQENGSDPKACAYCAEALKSDRFKAPKLRYAMHVVRYETRPGTSEIKDPFSASTQVYSFSEKVFAEIFGFKKEWGDLRQHDLIVHRDPSTAMAGVYKFSVAQKAGWLEDDTRKKYVAALMAQDNLAPDLSIFCGSRKTETQMGYDIRAVNEAWAVATGVNNRSATDAAMSSVGGSLGLADGLDDLVNSANAASSTTDEQGWYKEPEGGSEDAVPASALSFDDLTSSASTDSSPASGGAPDIDALLKGL